MSERNQEAQPGWIELIMGPMGSGKTTELLRRLDTHYIAHKVVTLIKPSVDVRSGRQIGTHGFRLAGALCFPTMLDASQNVMVQNATVVCIDEGQFFPDLADVCDNLANQGKIVIVAALSGDSNRKGFLPVTEIISKCEKITKLRAICVACWKHASFTWHSSDKTNQVKIGDLGEYIPLCRKCFLRWTLNGKPDNVSIPPIDEDEATDGEDT